MCRVGVFVLYPAVRMCSNNLSNDFYVQCVSTKNIVDRGFVINERHCCSKGLTAFSRLFRPKIWVARTAGATGPLVFGRSDTQTHYALIQE